MYKKLGYVHSEAVTQGQIADILQSRGDLDEALRIRQEQELPVYRKLGDVRSEAMTQGKIADILFRRGELDEALRIRQEQELPVYKKLGDVHSEAVTHGQIADILFGRGELDEALRIRQELQLPVYKKLGDVREEALVLFNIGQIEAARGDLQSAMARLSRSREINAQLRDVDGLPSSSLLLSQLYLKTGRKEQAIGLLEEAHELFAATGQRLGEAQCLVMAGPLLFQQGRAWAGLLALGRAGWLVRRMGLADDSFSENLAAARNAVQGQLRRMVDLAPADPGSVHRDMLAACLALTGGDLGEARGHFFHPEGAAELPHSAFGLEYLGGDVPGRIRAWGLDHLLVQRDVAAARKASQGKSARQLGRLCHGGKLWLRRTLPPGHRLCLHPICLYNDEYRAIRSQLRLRPLQ